MSKEKVGEIYLEAGIDESKLSGQFKKLKNNSKKSNDAMQKDFHKTKNSVKESTEGMSSHINRTIKRFIAWGVSIYAVMRIIRELTTVVKKAFTNLVEFQTGLRNVNSILGLSEGKLASFASQLLVIQKKLGISNKDLTTGWYQAASAGIAAADSMKFLELNAKAAKAGLATLTQSVDLSTTILNAFHKDVSETGDVLDVVQQIVNKGKTTFAELAASMSVAAADAAASNIPFKQIAGGIATITAQGVPTAQAMTQIRSSIIGLNKTLGDGWIKTMTYQEALVKVRRMSKGSSKELQTMMGSIEAVGAVLKMSGASAQMAADGLNAMKNAGGLMGKALSQQMKALGAKLDVLKERFNVFLIEAIQRLEPEINQALEGISKAMTKLEGRTEQVSATFKAMVGIIKWGGIIISNAWKGLITYGAIIGATFKSAISSVQTFITNITVGAKLIGELLVIPFKVMEVAAKTAFSNIGTAFDLFTKGKFKEAAKAMGDSIAENIATEFKVSFVKAEMYADIFKNNINSNAQGIIDNYKAVGEVIEQLFGKVEAPGVAAPEYGSTGTETETGGIDLERISVKQETIDELLKLDNQYDESYFDIIKKRNSAILNEEEKLQKERLSIQNKFTNLMGNAFYEILSGKFENVEEMFVNMVKRMLAKMASLFIVMNILGGGSMTFAQIAKQSLLGLHSGGTVTNKGGNWIDVSKVPHFSSGVDNFVVPPTGTTKDSFPVMVAPGETLNVTPAGQSSGTGNKEIVKAVEILTNVLKNKPVARVVRIGNVDLFDMVNAGEMEASDI